MIDLDNKKIHFLKKFWFKRDFIRCSPILTFWCIWYFGVFFNIGMGNPYTFPYVVTSFFVLVYHICRIWGYFFEE